MIDTQQATACDDDCGCYRHRRKVGIPLMRKRTWAVAFLDERDVVVGPLMGRSEDLDEVVKLLETIRATNPDAACIGLTETVEAEFVPNDHLYGL